MTHYLHHGFIRTEGVGSRLHELLRCITPVKLLAEYDFAQSPQVNQPQQGPAAVNHGKDVSIFTAYAVNNLAQIHVGRNARAVFLDQALQ